MGADPEFDRLLRTLGALARQRPKAVVEALMLWRKSKINQTPDVATLRAAAAGEPISKDVLVLIRERNSVRYSSNAHPLLRKSLVSVNLHSL